MTTIPCSTRVEITTLANLSKFLVEQGLTNPSQSKIIATSLELLHQHLVQHGQIILPVNDPMEAKKLLDELGILNVDPGRRGFRKFIETVQEKTLSGDFGTKEYLKRGAKRRTSTLNPRDLINPSALVEGCEMEEVMKAAEQKARERDEEFRQMQESFIPKEENDANK